MSTAHAWMDDKGSDGYDREPLEVVLSRIILAFGMIASLGVISVAVIWSSSPPNPRHTMPWRVSHGFRAAARTTIASERAAHATPPRSAVNRAQPPSS